MEAALRRQYLTQSGWLDSAESKLSQRAGKPVPWITYAAIHFLEQEIGGEQSIFEYGGGHSTLYWAERVRRVVAVDHDPAVAAYLRQRLPPNAELILSEENEPISERLASLSRNSPSLVDPEPIQAYRSGQPNEPFRAYALKLLEFSPMEFDVVIVDGKARVLSTWAAIRYFKKRGFIVFDNADLDLYQTAYSFLDASGYRRIDFYGLGPINPYGWCTAVFYQPAHFLATKWFKSEPSFDERAHGEKAMQSLTGTQRELELCRTETENKIEAASDVGDASRPAAEAEHDKAQAFLAQAELLARLSERINEVDQLRRQIESIHGSICWRLTWPIRWLHKQANRARKALLKTRLL
jgi:hypothetical protein